MLCYALLCSAMLCYALLCSAMLCLSPTLEWHCLAFSTDSDHEIGPRFQEGECTESTRYNVPCIPTNSRDTLNRTSTKLFRVFTRPVCSNLNQTTLTAPTARLDPRSERRKHELGLGFYVPMQVPMQGDGGPVDHVCPVVFAFTVHCKLV